MGCVGAVVDFLEHKWIFLTLKIEYRDRLPRFVRLPIAARFHKKFGQLVIVSGTLTQALLNCERDAHASFA
jgi:hypothetical protein